MSCRSAMRSNPAHAASVTSASPVSSVTAPDDMVAAMPLSLLPRRRATRTRKRTSVTLAPPAPDRKAWMPRSCCSSDVDGTSMSYPQSRNGRPGRITSHGNIAGTQEHQGPQASPGSRIHDQQRERGHPRPYKSACVGGLPRRRLHHVPEPILSSPLVPRHHRQADIPSICLTYRAARTHDSKHVLGIYARLSR